MEQVCELGRKLLYNTGKRSSKWNPGPPWDDNPAAFLRGLEEIPEGCRWLLDRWVERRNLVDRQVPWNKTDLFKLIRLQGKFPVEAINDPDLNALFLAWDAFCPGAAQAVWQHYHEQTPEYDPGFNYSMSWREIADRPRDTEEAWALFRSVVDEQISRLEELLGVHEEIGGDEAAELADRASFDASASFERLRRFQSAKSRELRQTLDALAKLRKTPPARHLGSGLGTLESQSADSRFQKEEDKRQMAEGEGQMTEGRTNPNKANFKPGKRPSPQARRPSETRRPSPA
jgi:hypothetical protein